MKKIILGIIVGIFLTLTYIAVQNFDRKGLAIRYIKSGISQNSAGFYGGSILSYKIALFLYPDSAWAYNALGTTYYNIAKYESYTTESSKKNYEKALKCYNKAIELVHNYPSAYVNRGNTRERLRQYKLALADYNKALELEPKNYDAQYGLAMVYSSNEFQEYDKAVDVLEKLVQTHPKNEELYFGLGWNYDKLDEGEKSIENYKKLVELNPKRVDAWINLSYVSELKLKDYEAGLKYADKALELNPYSLYAISNKAYALIQLKRYDEATPYVEKELKRDSEFSRAYFQLAQIKFAKGDKIGAKQDFLKAKDLENKYNFDDKQYIINIIDEFLKQCE